MIPIVSQENKVHVFINTMTYYFHLKSLKVTKVNLSD